LFNLQIKGNMGYSLLSHPLKYDFLESDVSVLNCTFFPGMPFAIRHWELSNTGPEQYRFGHRVMAVLNALPCAGLLPCWTEKIICTLFESCILRMCKQVAPEPLAPILPPEPLAPLLPPSSPLENKPQITQIPAKPITGKEKAISQNKQSFDKTRRVAHFQWPKKKYMTKAACLHYL
jgi:hypothetical protein